MSFRPLALLAVAGLLLASANTSLACDQCKSPFKPGIHVGETRILGNGAAYSWVILNEKGKPSSVGITFTETALSGLPQKPPAGMVGHEYVLALPKEAAKTHIDHVGLNWNPQGHPPAPIYDKPHFDVHFYLITPGERDRITLVGTDRARCVKPVPAAYMAPGYIRPPGTEEPMMGAHWVDPTSPELNGKPFTRTFIFGSYNGGIIFWEPMLTKAYLESRPDEIEAIKQPAAYAKSAYYPTRYHVRYDPDRHEYTVALEGMVWRVGTGLTKPAARQATKKIGIRKVSR